jgi:hypothetical protein
MNLFVGGSDGQKPEVQGKVTSATPFFQDAKQVLEACHRCSAIKIPHCPSDGYTGIHSAQTSTYIWAE